MSNELALKNIVTANAGKSFPAMDFVRRNPEIATAISKLVSPDVKPRFNRDGTQEFDAPDNNQFRQLSWKTQNSINDIQTVMQVLPDMELAAQILVSSIISPKDMMNTELFFMAPENILTSQASQEVLVSLRTYFDQVYKIKTQLNKIIRNMIIDKGSHVIAVIPENSVDELINRNSSVSMEELSDIADRNGNVRNIGILGKRVKPQQPPNVGFIKYAFESINDHEFNNFSPEDAKLSLSLESFGDKDYSPANAQLTPIDFVTVTDNFNVLKFPKLAKKLIDQKLQGQQHLSGSNKLLRNMNHRVLAMEADSSNNGAVKKIKKLSDKELVKLLYREQKTEYKLVDRLKTKNQLKRGTIGHPLIMELPSEAVIPVITPGQPDKHVAYFILVDETGNPINTSGAPDYHAEFANRLNSNTTSNSFASQLISRVGHLYGDKCSDAQKIEYSFKVYASMVEEDLMARLRNGVYGNGVALAKNDEIYRIMLSRTLKAQRTQLLFVPISMITYFAIDFTKDGIGKSIMEDMKIINSLRAMLTFSDVMAGVRNSVGMTNVKLKLDEEDPDPKKTIELAMDELIRARQQTFPLGQNSPVDIVNWLQRSGYNFVFEGHPGLPDVNVEFGETSTNYPKPDTELQESLRKRAIMSVGLNPETVDQGYNGELATSVISNNILLSRRVLQIQEKFSPLLTDHIRKVVYSDGDLLDELKEIVKNNYEKLTIPEELKGIDQEYIVDKLLYMFIEGIEVQLPKPNTVTVKNQGIALEEYIVLLDKLLDSWLSEEMFSNDVAGQGVSNNIRSYRAIVRAYYIRKWSSENGVLPELSEMTTQDEENKPIINLWDIQAEHVKSLLASFGKFMDKTQEPRSEANSAIDSAANASPGGGDSYSSGSFGSPTDDGFGGGSSGGGTDDFGLGDLSGTPGGSDETQTGNPENDEEGKSDTDTTKNNGGTGDELSTDSDTNNTGGTV